MTHYDDDTLLVAAAGDASPQLTRHLATCPACSARVQRLAHMITPRATITRPKPDFAAAHEELAVSEEELARFLATPQGPATLGLIKAATREAERALSRDPRETLRIVNTLLAREPLIDRTQFPRGVTSSARGELLKIASHAHRVMAHYDEALRLLDLAAAAYAQSITSDFDLATVDFSRAVILRELDRTTEADALLATARSVFERYGDERRVDQCMLMHAANAFRRAEYARAAAGFTAIITTSQDASTLAHAHLNRGQAHLHLGQEASRDFQEALVRFDLLGMPLEREKARWALARERLNRNAPASAELARVREFFTTGGMSEEAGLATLDLVEAALRDDDAAAAATYAADAVALFQRAQLGQRVREALAYLYDALRHQTATPAVVRYVRAHIEQIAAGTPTAFQPPN